MLNVASIPAMAGFRYPSFRRLAAGGVLMAIGMWGEIVVVGWMVLDQTDSTFLTAATFGVRLAPLMIFGPVAGAIADSVSRRRLLFLMGLAQAAVIAGMGILALDSAPQVWAVLLLVFVAGASRAFVIPTSQALVRDIVKPQHSMNALSLYYVAAHLVGVVGGLLGGAVTDAASPAIALFASAGATAAGSVVVRAMREPEHRESKPWDGIRAVVSDTMEGVRLMLATRVVATMLIVAVLSEVFGWTYVALLPAVARDILDIGATGLGSLTLMVGVGSLMGAMGLSTLGDFRRKGILLLGGTIGYGLFLVALSRTGLFPVALLLVACLGIASAICETMQMVLLQASVPDRFRGRVIGGWTFAIGLGWVGYFALGALADQIGVQWTLLISGTALLATGLAAYAVSPGLRKA